MIFCVTFRWIDKNLWNVYCWFFRSIISKKKLRRFQMMKQLQEAKQFIGKCFRLNLHAKFERNCEMCALKIFLLRENIYKQNHRGAETLMWCHNFIANDVENCSSFSLPWKLCSLQSYLIILVIFDGANLKLRAVLSQNCFRIKEDALAS